MNFLNGSGSQYKTHLWVSNCLFEYRFCKNLHLYGKSAQPYLVPLPALFHEMSLSITISSYILSTIITKPSTLKLKKTAVIAHFSSSSKWSFFCCTELSSIYLTKRQQRVSMQIAIGTKFLYSPAHKNKRLKPITQSYLSYHRSS